MVPKLVSDLILHVNAGTISHYHPSPLFVLLIDNFYKKILTQSCCDSPGWTGIHSCGISIVLAF